MMLCQRFMLETRDHPRILIQQIRFPLRDFSYSCIMIIWRLKFAGLFMFSGANAALNTPNRRLVATYAISGLF